MVIGLENNRMNYFVICAVELGLPKVLLKNVLCLRKKTGSQNQSGLTTLENGLYSRIIVEFVRINYETINKNTPHTKETIQELLAEN